MDSPFRSEFDLPRNGTVMSDPSVVSLNETCTYLCGNSLGPMSKQSKELVEEELSTWSTKGVDGHFNHPHGREWKHIADHASSILADIVGAKPSEVACMGTLTSNLHLLMNTFYKPTSTRYKILCEGKAFPSDQYAFQSQVKSYGYTPSDAIIELSPRQGEYYLRLEDILSTISTHGSSIALVLFSGVQYYTGQFFPIPAITQAAKAAGCVCGWDLAHAAGNVPLQLHDWDVDFAVWCSYKYLNSGPGGIAGLFVHEQHDDTLEIRAAGWWGHDPATRFAMPPTFVPIRGAQGLQQSNPSVLATASLIGSLFYFKEVGMPALRVRSVALTQRLWDGLVALPSYRPASQIGTESSSVVFTIITPDDPEARGAQLSLQFPGAGVMMRVYAELRRYGVVGDERKPDVIRIAPAPLYNNEADVDHAVEILGKVTVGLEI